MKFIFPLFLILIGCSRAEQPDRETALLVGDTIPIVSSPHRLSEENYNRLYRYYPKTLERIRQLEPLHVQDIKNMTRAGLSDETIIHEIHLTRSIFYLTPDDEYELYQAGVSTRVIKEMRATSDTSY